MNNAPNEADIRSKRQIIAQKMVMLKDYASHLIIMN